MRWLKWPVRAAVALALLAVAGVLWLLGTESGLRWALRFAPAEVTLEGARGTILGTIGFERVAFQGSEARQVEFELNLLALAADTVSIEFFRAQTLNIVRPQPSTGPTKTIPVRIRLANAEVKSLAFEGYEISDLWLDYSGSGAGHSALAWFSFAGARARVKVELTPEFLVQELDAAAQGLNLAVIDPAAPQTALELKLEGRGGAKGFAGRFSATNPQPGPLDRERLPFTRAQASFTTDYQTLTLTAMKVAMHPAGSIAGKGSADFQKESAALEIRVAELNLRGLYSTLAATRLSGPLALELSSSRQRVHGTLSQQDMSLSADAVRRGDEIEVRTLRARAGESEAAGSGRVRLGEPLRFDANLKLTRFDPSRFGDYPKGSINGALQARGDLGGSGSARWQISDSTLLGQSFASGGAAKMQRERVVDADAWATLGANRATAKGSFGTPRDRIAWTLQIPDLAALLPEYGGEIRASGTASGTWKQPSAVVDAQGTRLRLTKELVFEKALLQGSGTLEQHEATLSARGADLDFTGKVRGGWRADAWRGEILSLKNQGAYPLELTSAAQLEAGARGVTLGALEAEFAEGRAAVSSLRWQNGQLSTSGSISALPAQWLLTALHIDKLSGDLRIDGEWSLVSTPKLNGRLAVRRASGDLSLGENALELANSSFQAKFVDDRATVSAEIGSRLASVSLQGTTSGLAPDATLAFTAEVVAAELRSLTEPLLTNARISGRLSASLKIGGTLSAPQLSGALRGDALGFEMPPWGIALREGRLRAELDANRLRVTEARIAGGDGTFSASGTLPLVLAEGATLEWQAERLGVLARPDRRLVVSGKGGASFDGKRFGLKGELRADSGHFEVADDRLPQLADDVEIEGRAADDIRVARGGARLPLDLDLALDLGSRLTLRAYGYNGGVSGQVHVTTSPAGELLAQGRVHAVNATFNAYGQELAVDPGNLVFNGPLESPGLDIRAWRRHQQVEAGIHLTGTLQTPRVELISNPPVSESDALSWLVLGRAPTNASGADLAVLQAASGALFGRGGEPSLSRRFAQKFGMDELTVRSSGDLAGNVVALGKRYDKLYLSFEQAIGTTTEYLVKLDYALTQRFSLRGQTGTTSSVGVFYRYFWD